MVGPSEPAIVVRDVTVVRGGREAVKDMSVTVPAAKITGLIGPSGCGKTTLMRAIVGTQRRVSGEVTLLGLPAGSPSLRDRVGYTTQERSIYGDLTVRQNLRYFSRILRAEHTAVDRAMAEVGISDDAGQLVAALSGGQRQRVSLAVALLADADVLVLDEPTVGLDPVIRRDLWRMFRGLAAAGKTLLISSHVMDEADHCDELILMREGYLVAAGTPQALRTQTGTRSVEEAFLQLVDPAGEAEP